MENLQTPKDFDLASPDGKIISFISKTDSEAIVVVSIEKIATNFIGFQIDLKQVHFNIKSTLAQLGLNGVDEEIVFNEGKRAAEVRVRLTAIGPIAKQMLTFIEIGAYIGKLFAADERRRVRSPEYLGRMFGRSDRFGKPLLSLGGLHGSDDLILEKIDGRTVAYLTLQYGVVNYSEEIDGFIPTIAKALIAKVPIRDMLKLHQTWVPDASRTAVEGQILLVKTQPLHVRTVYGRVVNELLPPGYTHTSASILQPDTKDSGDIYELFGNSTREITDIPLEFYTLEPYREYVFFSDRDQLQTSLEDSKILFNAFETAPLPKDLEACTFIAKGQQLLNLSTKDWITRELRFQEFPGLTQGTRQALMVERFIEQQPSYPFLRYIEDGYITSQGVLLTRYFPSPLMKRMLLSDLVQRCVKGIYFQYPSHNYQIFFSAEDQALLHDLEKFAIPVYWVDEQTKNILKYVQKPGRDSGMFVPLKYVDTYLKSTTFGIYGSNLLQENLGQELKLLLQGVLDMRQELNHPLLNAETPLALVTGGGPGAMEIGNKVATELGILSCANIVDFRPKGSGVINEQKQNPYVQAKMTYRLEKLVERQSEFHLDFPIFLRGGIGTDFEFCLEEVRRKVGATVSTPIVLWGDADYWKEKITSRYQNNLKNGTIKGSEWISHCFFAINSAEAGIRLYRSYFEGTLPIGKNAPLTEYGFVVYE